MIFSTAGEPKLIGSKKINKKIVIFHKKVLTILKKCVNIFKLTNENLILQKNFLKNFKKSIDKSFKLC